MADDNLAAAMIANDGMVQKFWKNAKKLEHAVNRLALTASTFKEERNELRQNFLLDKGDMNWLDVKSTYPGLNKSVKRELVSTAMADFLPQAARLIKARMSSAEKAIEKLAPPPPARLEWSIEAEYELKAVKAELRKELYSTANIIDLAMMKMLTNPHSTLRKRRPTKFQSQAPKTPLAELQGVLHLIKDEIQDEVAAIPSQSRVKIEANIAREMDKHLHEELSQLKASRGLYLKRDLLDKTACHTEAKTTTLIREEQRADRLADLKYQRDGIGLIRVALARSAISGLPVSYYLKQLCNVKRPRKRFSKSEDQLLLRLRATIFLQRSFRHRKMRRQLQSTLEQLRENRVTAAIDKTDARRGLSISSQKEIAAFKDLVCSKCITKSPLLAWRSLLDKKCTGKITFRDLIAFCVTYNTTVHYHVLHSLTSSGGVCTLKEWDQYSAVVLKEFGKSLTQRHPQCSDWFALFSRSRTLSSRQFQQKCAELKLIEPVKAKHLARHLSSREDGSLTPDDFRWIQNSMRSLT